MGALGQSLDLVFRMKAEGADAVQRDIKQTSAIIQKETGNTSLQTKTQLDDLTKSSATSSGELASLGAIASGTAVAVGALAVGVGAAAYGLFTLANAAAKSGQDLFKLQQATGLNAETLSSLRLAAIEANVELGSLNDILVDFTQLMLQASNGNKEAKDTLAELGVTATTADEGFEQLLQKIREAPDPMKAAELASKATGASIADLQRIAQQTQGDLDALKERAKQLGIVLDNDAAKAANEFAKDMEIVTLQVQAQAYAFAREYMPQISSALRSVGQFLADNRESFVFWGQTVGYYIFVHIDSFARFARAVQQAGAIVFSAMQSMASSVSSAMISIGNSIGGVIGRFVTLFGLMAKARLMAGESFGTGEGSAGLGLGSPDAFLTGVPKVATPKVVGASPRGGGGGGRARGGGGGTGAKVETAEEKAKRLAEEALKAENDKVAAQERDDDRLLQLATSEMEERLALARKEVAEKIKTQEEYAAYLALNQRAQKMFEIELLKSRLELVKLNAEERKKIEAQISKLETEIRVNSIDEQVEALKNKSEILQEIADRYTKIRDEALKAAEVEKDAQARITRSRLEGSVKDAKNAKDKRAAIEKLYAFEVSEIQRKESAELAQIENRKQRDLDKLTDLEKQQGLEKAIEDRWLAEDKAAREKADAEEIEAARKKEEELSKVKEKRKGFKGIYDDLKDDEKTAKDFGSAIEAIGNQAAAVMQNMGNAVGDAIAQWALYGGSVGKALKQALAAELAYLAGWATVQALRSTAWGFLMLATGQFDKAGAAFLAAGLFAALAGGSALAARALSGGGKSTQNQAYDFRSNTIDSNNSSRAAGNTTQMLSESRTQRQDQRITLEVQSRDSHIVRVVGDNLNQRGDLFPVVVRLVEQN